MTKYSYKNYGDELEIYKGKNGNIHIDAQNSSARPGDHQETYIELDMDEARELYFVLLKMMMD